MSYWRLLPADHECTACGHAGAVVLVLDVGEPDAAGRASTAVQAECRYCGHAEEQPHHLAASEHWHVTDYEGRDPAGRCFAADAQMCRIAHEASEPGSLFTAQTASGQYEARLGVAGLEVRRG